MATVNFIQKAIKKPGALHRSLGVGKGAKIPKSFMSKIANAKVGSVVENPTKTGRKKIKVTDKLKKRVSLAKTLSKMRGNA